MTFAAGDNEGVTDRGAEAVNGVLAGRSAELRRVRSAVTGVALGTGGVLLLVGEAGIGKSALAAAAVDAAPDGVRTAVAHAVPLTIEQPLAPWRAVLRSLGAGFDSHDRTLIEATVGDPVSLLTQRVIGALDEVADAGPVLVVLEDLHWADTATLAVLHHLATREEGGRLAVVATARPPARGTSLHLLVGVLGGAVLPLAALTAHDVDTLVAGAVGGRAGPRLRALVETGGGNPLLVHALVDAAVSSGVVPEDGVVDLAAELRPTPGGPIAAQVEGLPAPVLHLVQLAAIADGPVRPDLLARLTERRPAAVLADLDVAVHAGVLRHDGDDIVFRHDLHRAAAVETIAPAGRAAIHLDIAEHLEELGADRLEIAEHLARGARRGNRRAVRQLTATAEGLVGHDPATARRVVELAVDLVAEPEIPLDLQVVRLGALAACGEAGEADKLGGVLLGQRLDAVTERRIRRDLALAAFVSGRSHDAATHMTRVAEIAPDVETAARARTELAWAQFLGLDHAAAAEGARIGARSSDPTTRIAALALQCWVGLWRLDRQTAVAAADELTDLVPRTGRGEWLVFQPLLGVAAVRIETGDLDACAAVIDEGRRLAVDSGAAWAAPAYDAMAAAVDVRRGELTSAAARASLALSGTALVDGFGVEVWSRAQLARFALLVDADATAEEQVDAAHLAAHDGRAQLGLEQLVLAEAELLTARGETAAATDVLDGGWDVLGAVGVQYVRGPVGVALVRSLSMTGGDVERADEVVRTLRDAAAQSRLPGLVCDARRAEAWRLRTPEAVALSVDAARALGQPLVLFEAHRDAATILGRTDDARRHRDAAALLATHLGIPDADARPARRQRLARPVSGLASLTEAERRVATMVSEGMTNARIAAKLGVSRRTVDTQVLACYRKLGVKSRVELTRVLLDA